jgi:uncharacterized protein YyaL (SSP411 family)
MPSAPNTRTRLVGQRSSFSARWPHPAAETDDVEGATYVWTRAQLAGFLSPDAYELAVSQLGADSEDEPFTLVRRSGRGESPEVLDAVLDTIKAERDRRPQPGPDTKLVTSWNAMVARGLMEAGATFSDHGMAALGLSTLVTILERTLTPDGLVHVADDPSLAGVRLIEDAAHTAAACLTAFEATGDGVWLERAVHLHSGLMAEFAQDGVLYMTPATTELPVRPREQSDQPTPSGASTAIENAVRLAEKTGEKEYASWARKALRHYWAISDFAPEQSGKALEAAALLEPRP